MPSFTLNTSFTKEDLIRFLASGSNVVVAKPNNGGAPNVAWVVFKPLTNNTMTWEENYGIYASNTDLIAGGVISQVSRTPYPATAGKTYELAPTGAFGEPGASGPAGSYIAINSYNNLPKGYMTFGLYQKADVNGSPTGSNPVSAASVIYQSRAEITPFTNVYLWIQSQVVSSSVITNVTSPLSKVTFGGDTTDVSLKYDSETGMFVTAPGTELGDGIILEYFDPAL